MCYAVQLHMIEAYDGNAFYFVLLQFLVLRAHGILSTVSETNNIQVALPCVPSKTYLTC